MIKNIILLLFIVPIINTSCNNTVPIEKIVYVPVKDTINEQENIAKIIANYKLAKIKEYNRLAGNGNNIKFLRGWINRTLNE